MATPVQDNLVRKNAQYASNFADGSLELPPAKRYAVGMQYSFLINPKVGVGITADPSNASDLNASHLHGRPY